MTPITITLPVSNNTISHPFGTTVSKPYIGIDEGGGSMLWFNKKDGQYTIPDGINISSVLRFGDTDAAGGKRWGKASFLSLSNTELRLSVTSTNVPGLLTPAPAPARAATVDTSRVNPAPPSAPLAQPRSAPATDTAGPALLPMAILPRTLLNLGAHKPTVNTVTSLDEVESKLRVLEEMRDPEDIVIDLRETDIEVQQGMLILNSGPAHGLLGLTRTGMRGLAAAFTPHSIQYGEARKMWRVLMQEGLEEAKAMIPMAWHLLTRRNEGKVQLRTVLTKDPRINSVARVVRSVTSSSGYTAVDDLDLIKALRSNGKWGKAVVASYSKSDDYSSLRILPEGLPATVDTPVPVLDLRNSETGCLSVRMDGGSYILRCTNGLFSIENKSSMRWNHTGNINRILEGINSGADAIMREATGITANYLEARQVRVEGMAMWMQQRLAELRKHGLKERTATAALASLGQHTTSRPDTVAFAVDALTLAAQTEEDLDSRKQAEEFGYIMVMDALAKARAMREAGKEPVLVPVVEKREVA